MTQPDRPSRRADQAAARAPGGAARAFAEFDNVDR